MMPQIKKPSILGTMLTMKNPHIHYTQAHFAETALKLAFRELATSLEKIIPLRLVGCFSLIPCTLGVRKDGVCICP